MYFSFVINPRQFSPQWASSAHIRLVLLPRYHCKFQNPCTATLHFCVSLFCFFICSFHILPNSSESASTQHLTSAPASQNWKNCVNCLKIKLEYFSSGDSLFESWLTLLKYIELFELFRFFILFFFKEKI